MAEASGQRLRLRAEDMEDLAVFSAMLQDACAPLREMAFDAEGRRFLAAFNRCCRESQPENCAPERLAVLRIERVRAVTHRGFITSDLERIHHLVLFMQEPEDAVNDGVYLTLVFRDGSAIRVEADAVDCRLEDLDGVGGDGQATEPAA